MTDTTTPGGQSSSGSSPIGDELSGDANRLKQTAAKRVGEEADKRKDQATTVARSASSAISKAAEEMRNDDNTPSWLVSAFETTAQQVEQFASTIEDKGVGEIRRDVSDFARRSPGTFLAASAAAGFAAARILRAGSEYKGHQQSGQDGSKGSTVQPYEPSTAGGGSSVWPAGQTSPATSREGTML